MPSYNYECPGCGRGFRLFRKTEPETDPVCTCGVSVPRSIKGPTMRAVETLDSGRTRRSIERLVDAERLSKERTAAHDREVEKQKGALHSLVPRR